MSTAGPYLSSPSSSSGGRYHNVITLLVYGRSLSSDWYNRARPRSASFSSPLHTAFTPVTWVQSLACIHLYYTTHGIYTCHLSAVTCMYSPVLHYTQHLHLSLESSHLHVFTCTTLHTAFTPVTWVQSPACIHLYYTTHSIHTCHLSPVTCMYSPVL